MKKYFVALSAFALCLGIFTTDANAAGKETIEKGVYIGEVDVSDKTIIEAKQAVLDYVETQGEKEITLNAMNNNKITVPLSDLSITWINEDVVEEAAALGKQGNIIKRYKTLKDLEHENKVYDISYDFDRTKLREIIETDCAAFNVSAQDATLKREDGKFVIEPGTTGVVIDVDASVNTVYEYLTTDWMGENTETDLVVAVEEPRGTEEELSKIKDVLGTFTTDYSSSGANRSGNVTNGAKHVNGTLLYPGDSFSMYETVSPFTEANGYYLAGSYLNGMVVDSLGGGICQVSTTLYNAVLRAELEVTERSNHSMIVSYVDPSADAAIAGTYKDFKFKNNTNAPVYIEGYTTDDKQVVFNIYGEETRPAGRTIKFTNKVLESTPAVTQLVADPAQGIGYRIVESGHNGCKAELYKEVYVDGVLQSSEKVNKSNYQVSNRMVYYGINGDPFVSAQLQNCIAAGDEAGANALLGI